MKHLSRKNILLVSMLLVAAGSICYIAVSKANDEKEQTVSSMQFRDDEPAMISVGKVTPAEATIRVATALPFCVSRPLNNNSDTSIFVAPGGYKITITAKGYEPKIVEVSLHEKDKFQLDASLKKLDHTLILDHTLTKEP